MKLVLCILGYWFLAAVILGLILGRIIRAGDGG